MTGDDQKYNYVIKIGETIANFFSSLAVAIASFLIIASFITLIDVDGVVIVQDSLRVKSPVLRIVGENKSEGMDILNDDIDAMLDFLNKIPV